MRRWINAILLLGGVLAFSAYAVLGETGPVGWLNGWQAARSGSYSRTVSWGVMFVALLVIGGLLAAAWLWVRDTFLGGPPAPRPGQPPEPLLGGLPPMPKATMGFWPGSLLALAVLLALAWGGVLAWHVHDWRQRASDAGSDYVPRSLARGAAPERPADDSHLALQGRLSWDHALVRRTKNGASTEPEVVFVPVVGTDWRAGDPVHFVAQMGQADVWRLQHRQDGADAALRVRVDGAVPGATRPVFEQGGSPLSDAAVVVHVMDAPDGQPADAHPVFDWDSAVLIGGGLSGFIALLWTTAVVTYRLKQRMLRRRAAR